jgi:DNA-binding IclR family transcriptional regulator
VVQFVQTAPLPRISGKDIWIYPLQKLEVLTIFANVGGHLLKPAQVLDELQAGLELRSFYSYLARLRRQGLLERDPRCRRGELAYRITERGRERLAYLREHPRQRETKNC